MRPNTPDDFWRRVDRSGGPDACWPWTGAVTTRGYGRFPMRNMTVRAHRHAFELTKGLIAADEIIRHDCDNPPCCNPRHLRRGTLSDNTLDAVRRGRWSQGAARLNAKLTPDDVREIRRLAGTMTMAELAARFATSSSNVHLIIHGRRWDPLYVDEDAA